MVLPYCAKEGFTLKMDDGELLSALDSPELTEVVAITTTGQRVVSAKVSAHQKPMAEEPHRVSSCRVVYSCVPGLKCRAFQPQPHKSKLYWPCKELQIKQKS